jgi:hypothetical protein
LSRASNDLGQWRAYADNGRGFAIGFAPHIFEAFDNPNPQPTEHFVMPVAYGEESAMHRYKVAIEKAVAVITATRPHLAAEAVKNLFLREVTNRIISGHLIPIGLATKHDAYRHEEEVRLVIIGTTASQAPHVKTRVRGSEIVPFIEGDPLPLRDKDGIFEIIVGPAAAPSALDGVQSLLQSFGIHGKTRVRESGIPYRALWRTMGHPSGFRSTDTVWIRLLD